MDSLTRIVVETLPLADDLDLHVSVVEVGGVRGVDIRNYIPSTQTYGRGVIVPYEQLRALRTALGKA